MYDYVHYCRTQTDANPGFHLAVGLTILANMAPSKLRFHHNGKKQRLNLYTILIGDSATSRKSTSVDIGTSVFEGAGQAPRVLPSPDSFQGLIKGAAELEDPQLLVLEPEFSRFLASSGGNGYLAPLKLAYTQAYDEDRLGRTTKDGSMFVEGVSLSLLAGVAPVHIEDHMTQTDLMGGFWARFMVMACDAGEYQEHNEARPELLQALIYKIKWYREHTPEHWYRDNIDLTEDAKLLLNRWGRDTHAYAKRLSATDPQRGTAARAHVITKKVAALYAYDRMMHRYFQARDDADEMAEIASEQILVNQQDMTHAISVAKLHVRSAFEVVDAIAASPQMRARRRVLHIIMDAKGSPIDEGKIALGAKMLLKDLNPILDTLKAQGLIAEMPHTDASDLRRKWVAVKTPEQLTEERELVQKPPEGLEGLATSDVGYSDVHEVYVGDEYDHPNDGPDDGA